jgi:hypothetical protein
MTQEKQKIIILLSTKMNKTKEKYLEHPLHILREKVFFAEVENGHGQPENNFHAINQKGVHHPW